MHAKAELHTLLRAKNENGRNRLKSRVVTTFPLPLQEESSQRYWKDNGVYDVQFSIQLNEDWSAVEVVGQLLAAAWSIGSPWTVLSVGQPYTEGWEFEAIADHRTATIKIPGVEWLRLSLLLN